MWRNPTGIRNVENSFVSPHELFSVGGSPRREALCLHMEKPSVLTCPLPGTRHPTLEGNLVHGVGVGKHSGKRNSLLSVCKVTLQRSHVRVRRWKSLQPVFVLVTIQGHPVVRGPIRAVTEPAVCFLLIQHHRTWEGEAPCAHHTFGKASGQGSTRLGTRGVTLKRGPSVREGPRRKLPPHPTPENSQWEQPFTHTERGKTFLRRGTLTGHEKIHTARLGERSECGELSCTCSSHSALGRSHCGAPLRSMTSPVSHIRRVISTRKPSLYYFASGDSALKGFNSPPGSC